jgi:hypothetical protein
MDTNIEVIGSKAHSQAGPPSDGMTGYVELSGFSEKEEEKRRQIETRIANVPIYPSFAYHHI